MTSSLGVSLVTGLVMLALALKTELVTFRRTTSRCGACGRLFRRGTTCRCADGSSGH